MNQQDVIERKARAYLRKLGFHVESVSQMQRSTDDEFAAFVLPLEGEGPHFDRLREEYLDFLTMPGCPVEITREHVGRQDHRIYVQPSKIF